MVSSFVWAKEHDAYVSSFNQGSNTGALPLETSQMPDWGQENSSPIQKVVGQIEIQISDAEKESLEEDRLKKKLMSAHEAVDDYEFHWERKVRSWFAHYSPAELPNVRYIVAEWKGREEELLQNLDREYKARNECGGTEDEFKEILRAAHQGEAPRFKGERGLVKKVDLSMEPQGLLKEEEPQISPRGRTRGASRSEAQADHRAASSKASPGSPKSPKTAQRSEENEINGPARKQGVIEKKGSGTSMFGRRNWNRRFVVLEGGFIGYYPSVKDVGDKELAKFVNIFDAASLRGGVWTPPHPVNRAHIDVRAFNKPKDGTPNRVLIEVDLPHYKNKADTLYFALSDPRRGEVDSWVVAFKNHLAYFSQNGPDQDCEAFQVPFES